MYSNTQYGIYVYPSSNNNIITSNQIYNNDYGIHIYSSLNNNITSNRIYNNNYGIHIYSSSNNNIASNQIYSNTQYGIYISNSSNSNIITSNQVYNNNYGIHIYSSSKNILRENSLNNNTYNFGIIGDTISDYYQDISNSNKIGDKSVYYIVEQRNLIFDEKTKVGYLGLISCNNISVKNLTLINNYHGLLLVNSSSSTITSNHIYNNSYGIYLYSSSNNNIITLNQIYNNSYGIYLYYSFNNEIHYQNIYNNMDYGIYNYNPEYRYRANATYNWWDSPNGPSGVGPGYGNSITTNVFYNPWLIEPLDFTPPTVIKTLPNNGDIDVPLDTNIGIKFSEKMNISTIPGNITIIPKIEIKNYVWTEDNSVLTLLTSNLLSNTTYTITIETNITDSGTMDSNGCAHLIENNLKSHYTFSFRTKYITPPMLTIISPENGTITNQNITFIYTVSDDLENLTVEGPANGTVYSNEGSYTITIMVKDRANNTAEEIVMFTIDKTPPSINITGVIDGFYYNFNVTPNITITDTNLNATSVSTELNGKGFVSGVAIIGEGGYVLDVKAKDKAGNENRLYICFTIDKQPPILVIKSLPDFTNQTEIKIEGETEKGADLWTDDKKIEVKDSKFSTLITLKEGENIVRIEARDQAGNFELEIRKIILDLAAPQIIFSTPLNNSKIEKPNINLKIKVKDNINIKKINIEKYKTEFKCEKGNKELEVGTNITLKFGKNILYVSVED
ncbi:MAG: right-handed parallel beta-helix repeat-containing protein, partial [Candidatus Thermoplasmatota archaeon]